MGEALTYNKNYLLVFQASLLGNLGSWVYHLANAFLIWELTQSGFWVSALGLASLIPNIVFSPIGGAISDRINVQLASYIICFCFAITYLSIGLSISFFSIETQPYSIVMGAALLSLHRVAYEHGYLYPLFFL